MSNTFTFLEKLKTSENDIKKRFSQYRKISFFLSTLLSFSVAIFIAHDFLSFSFSFIAFSGLSFYTCYFLSFLYECKANDTIRKSAQLSHVLSNDKNWEIIAKNSKIIK